MITERRRWQNRRNYYLRKIKRVFAEHGLEVKRGWHCITIQVWEHPHRDQVRPGDTVGISKCVNWDEEEGYVWNEFDGSRVTCRDILPVVHAFQRMTREYAECYKTTGKVKAF